LPTTVVTTTTFSLLNAQSRYPVAYPIAQLIYASSPLACGLSRVLTLAVRCPVLVVPASRMPAASDNARRCCQQLPSRINADR
jgi:hypothetical protein